MIKLIKVGLGFTSIIFTYIDFNFSKEIKSLTYDESSSKRSGCLNRSGFLLASFACHKQGLQVRLDSLKPTNTTDTYGLT